MAVSGIQGSPSPPASTAVQNPVQQQPQRKVNDHDGDAADLRADQRAALNGTATAKRLLDVKA